MKNTDIAMVVLIASISVGIAFAVVNAIPALKTSDLSEKISTIDKYSADVDEPDGAVFNKDAINPTVDVTIGEAQQ